MKPEIFKAYDIRGIYPTEIDEADAKAIAMAYAEWLKPKTVALGRDVRLSGESLWKATAEGLTEMGVNVVDIGVISTDMLYFSVANYNLDGGITLSASHNAGEYNGMKMVRAEAKPISIDSGIAEIRDLAIKNQFITAPLKGTITKKDILNDYVTKMTSLIDKTKIKPLNMLVNPNFGAAGSAIDKIATNYQATLTKINFEPNGHFPKGKPDPTQIANRQETAALAKTGKYDFSAIWDADADRCFFYDEKGNFILPYYVTGLMMDYFLAKLPEATFVIDPRLIWMPQIIAEAAHAKIAINKSGHSFIKERMRSEDAVFGAETSAHYYFKDLWYTDNGMIPFVIMLELVSKSGLPLSEMIKKYQQMSYALEETNFFVESVPETIATIKAKYSDGEISTIDGVSIAFKDWRMNLRGSNTEPVIRLNIEAKSQDLAKKKLAELTEAIGGKKA